MARTSQTLDELLTDLDSLITSRGGRVTHYLPDLALKMLAAQVLQYGRAYRHLDEGGFVSWSFPIARAAFETAQDLMYLALAPDSKEYDRRGALAHVGAEIAVSKTNGLAREAAPGVVVEDSLPEKERIKILAAEWQAYRPEAEQIVQDAYLDAKRSWKGGNKSWTLLSRRATHDALEEHLGDDALARVYRSWYDVLAHRAHPGLHSPQLNRHGQGHQFLVDGDEGNPIPSASVRVALYMACFSLQHQFQVWDSESLDGPSGTSESRIDGH